MKQLIILFLFVSSICLGQELKTAKSSTFNRLAKEKSFEARASVININDSLFIDLEFVPSLSQAFEVAKGSKLFIQTKRAGGFPLYSVSQAKSSKSFGRKKDKEGAVIRYFVDKESLKKLLGSEVEKIRIEVSPSEFEGNVAGNDSDVFRQALNLLK